MASTEGRKPRYGHGFPRGLVLCGLALVFSSVSCEGTQRVYGPGLGPIDSGPDPSVEVTSPALTPNVSPTPNPPPSSEGQGPVTDRANSSPAGTPPSPPVAPEPQPCQGSQAPNGSCTPDAGTQPSATSQCQVDGDCAAFERQRACTGGADGRCVQCTDDADCTANPAGAVCKLSADGGPAPTNTCVECLANTDCPNPAASHCVQNQCQPCAVNDDCSHVVSGEAQLAVCDTSLFPSQCVECTSTQRTACGATVCNGSTRQCENRSIGSAGICESCISDAECIPAARCAVHVFGGAELGAFCFPISQDESCPQTPFSGLANGVTTIDGELADLCLLRRTTCAAIDDSGLLGKDCTASSDCGLPNVDDGVCDAALGKCSFPCISPFDCPGGAGSCLGGICQL